MKSLIMIKDLDAWGACGRQDDKTYSDANLHRLLRDRKGWTPLEVSRMRSVPVEDRVWVLLRPQVLGRSGLLRVLSDIADRAVRRHALRCGAEFVEVWARKWLSGEDRSEVSAAGAWAVAAGAAREAAWAATRLAAVSSGDWASWAVAVSAARSAGWAASEAARSAARWAGWAASEDARSAARAAEYRWHLSRIRRELRESK